MNPKTVLITGATDGIGKQTAYELGLLGYSIIVHGRGEQRVEQTVSDIKRSIKTDAGRQFVEGIVCDLSSLTKVRKFANEIEKRFDKLDVLINNAGVYMKEKALTVDGFEMTFAVNHLAHFLLTNLLIELIQKSDDGRIINVSSIAHQNAKLDFENLNAEKGYSPYGAYSLSKLANILFTKELSNRLGNKISVNALHPGVISTKLLRAGFNMQGGSLEKGAENSIFLAHSEKIKSITGEYFVDLKPSSVHSAANDDRAVKQFWDASAQMVGL